VSTKPDDTFNLKPPTFNFLVIAAVIYFLVVKPLQRLMDKYKTNAAGRSLAKVVLAAGEFGRPLVVAPGVPADRLRILRDAFDKSVSDPALLATAEKRRLEMDPASGSELESLAKEVMAATPDVVQRMEKLLSGK